MWLMYISIFSILLLLLVYIVAYLKNEKHIFIEEVKDVLLTKEELINHGKELGRSHTSFKKVDVKDFLLYNLDKNFEEIEKIYLKLNGEVNANFELPKASEWLLDNFYIIELQYKRIRQSLEGEKEIKLNTLESGTLKGYPRTYVLALELVSHTEGVVLEDFLVDFVNAYQEENILTIKEVSYLSLMLTLSLMEYIKNVCIKIHNINEQWRKADEIDFKTVFKSENKFGSNFNLNSSFLQRLFFRMRKNEETESIAILEKKLNYLGTSIKNIIEKEYNKQATLRMTIGNCIISLKDISNLDWTDIFDSVCIVEEILKEDPLDVYTNMDENSKNYYKFHVEKLAYKLNVQETFVAKKALELAKEKYDEGRRDKKAHVGFYIVDRGRSEIFESLGKKDWENGIYLKSEKYYILPIIFSTLIIEIFICRYAYLNSNLGMTILVGLATWVPLVSIFISIFNRIFSRIFLPVLLPKLELKSGISDDMKTFIVIPTLLTDLKRVEELAEQLEMHYLANREENLYFALVGDFKDSESETINEDALIIRAGLEAIEKLNNKYSKNEKIFYYFHRDRVYSNTQNRWMGWERKRGALVELNDLLLGEKDTTYSVISSDISHLQGNIKYIITLDADTKLPLETAKKLIGTISHPLNVAVVDEKKNIVKEGYGLIQPRILVDIESSNKSIFTRIYSGQGGIDPYTTAVSDIYQDLFGEGIFTGKGIYNLEVFQKCLKNSIPENSILSHDLLEGSYIRVGLATDIELIDGYPQKYISFIMRLHRWVRGDWQLIRWLKNSSENVISKLSRWKIMDNLRRSILAPSLLLLTILGFSIFPGNTFVYLGIVLLAIFLPFLLSLASKILHGKAPKRILLHGDKMSVLKGGFYQGILSIVFLPYEAFIMMDAICRTLYRVFISKKNLLEWTTAFDMEKKLKNDFKSHFIRMKSSIVLSIVNIFMVYVFKIENIYLASIVSGLWFISPMIAYFISIPDGENKEYIHIPQIVEIARKTWDYYETFANEENNFLPPDNFQEFPYNGVAYRTSPTNIGFLLLAILSARDFGYITTSEMIRYISRVVDSIEKMDKWEGHLFNWYNTKTLKPLRPYFVSTVDSGNFVSYLYVLNSGLKEYLEKPLMDKKLFCGLLDTINLIENENDRVEILEQLKKLEDDDINGLKAIYNDVLKRKEILKDKWIENSLNRIEALLHEYSTFMPNELLSKTIEYGYEKIDREISLIGLKGYYEENLRLVKDESTKEEIMVLYQNVSDLISKTENLIDKVDKFIEETEFAPLYDEKKNLFSIGYNVEDKKMLDSYYDLLASEARITSYIAICRGEVPKKHWFKLGRSLIVKNGYISLASWTGTMFEYLMPSLIMKDYKNTLLNETYNTAIKIQREYCKKKKIPWGISESGFFAFDVNLNYQYKAFGVPQLGFKRGLREDLVISPYSSMLALNFAPQYVSLNINNLLRENMNGEYGLYEAIDYTSKRLPQNMNKAIVKSYMTHHQGMIFLAINNFLNNNILIDRFHRNPQIKIGEILLQEKIPTNIIVAKEKENTMDMEYRMTKKEMQVVRSYGKKHLGELECHILSSGNYSLLITNRGSGYSKKDNIFLNRWRRDLYTRQYGTFIYIKDLTHDKYWSAAYEPTRIEPDEYNVKFSNDKVTFYRRDGFIETKMDTVLFSEDDGEIRKIKLTNNSDEDVLIEVMSYFELVGDRLESDMAHPVFSNLFVKTEVVPEYEALIGYRRKRSEDINAVWIVHSVKAEGSSQDSFQYETNRGNFIGRGNDIKNPNCLYRDLTNTVGSVLDPIMSIKKRVKIKSGDSIDICFITGISDSKEKAIDIAKKYRDEISLSLAFELAYTRSQTEIGYLNYKKEEVQFYDRLLSKLIFPSNGDKREYEDIIKKNTKGQEGLWAYGISGDNPIILVRIKTLEGLDTLKEILKAHGYWTFKGISLDLVILNEDESIYYQPLFESIQEVVYEYRGNMLNISGGIFIRNEINMSFEDKALLFKWATMIVNCEEGFSKEKKLTYHIQYRNFEEQNLEYPMIEVPLSLDFFNGYGGFSKDGEYIIRLAESVNTPLPWVNVIANRNFGFIVSETGIGFTWAHNSRENKLTPWYNDTLLDVPGEIIYLRDDKDGHIWTMTPSPIREKEEYIITHGQGYSRFYHYSHGIEQILDVYVPLEENIKINLIKLKNNSNIERKLTIVYYIRPVLGVSDEITARNIETYMDKTTDIFVIKNSTNTEFKGSTIFLASSIDIKSFTGDRIEFLGNFGSLEKPEGLKKDILSNRAGIGYDPCGAIEMELSIPGGSQCEITLLMAESQNIESGYDLVKKYKDVEKSKEALNMAQNYWKEKLDIIKVSTPDPSMNLLMNNWLIYQTVVSRMWARAGFYQVGGAYGARDQMQDAMNAIYVFPGECRRQILNVCRHQFKEGDVQHWWHPSPMTDIHKGIRTKYTDDLLWLPYATEEYVSITGDYSILDEKVPFIESEVLNEEEQERYEVPSLSNEIGTVYEHCIRAIEKSLKFGERGLPLMGSGDWNDGMNKVGYKGKGESIWLGWFLGSVLKDFIPICKYKKDEERAKKYEKVLYDLKVAMGKNAWDGDWYLRAYFDDGTPLGSKENDECRIDSISQSWAVISSLGEKEKNKKALESVQKYLIREEDGMILLLTPPFSDGVLDPGYIKSYVPGVRENGAQYTHAAAWVIGAFAMMGEGDKALKLFNMINPINHARTQLECSKYKVEPYVIAADIYGIEPHVGRGGWSWYTGSSGWMYKIGLEDILGFRVEKDRLYIKPCIPRDWSLYNIEYKYFDTIYTIEVKNPHKVNSGERHIQIDGRDIKEEYINLVNDKISHFVQVEIKEK
ncbi:MAG: Cellobiose phosphorylase [Sporanaerobacter sp.]|jgi:cyclic beta-1,2-glucan synthetase|uniref:GH36-type glycosyl hydrolase domain-containing protein n=1 Tax=Sporanaerobacter sp. TaxID=2010183 RepID=UPI003A1021F7